ncbi:transcriptional regulator [Bremerella cremea]|uniref:Transcriptional regulator n=1 Tax=Bremerella cremea TaxID=1031537 RepID=A0A368KRQ4_9BACT|nr:helix-turn-helix transcriptional regulator [Bremerella cremea]RCS46308.1 transcriptional regulator [Bremerella cremea]
MPRKREPRLDNRVKDLRAAKGNVTQQVLADEVGVTRQTIVALEGGAYTPSLTLALKISKYFGKSVEEIFWMNEV